MSIFKKNGIKIISKTIPPACGGTDATLDTNAPTEIKSNEMILFDVFSALNPPRELWQNRDETLGFVAAFAAKTAGGTFMFLDKRDGYKRESKSGWAIVKEDVMPCLCELVCECNIAKNNGFHSKTHGLPENFGGDIDVRYADGENISISDNQSPVLRYETGVKIANLFDEKMKGEKVSLPDVSSLMSIVFEEKRKNGGYTHATLSLNEDGTGTNVKACRYDDPTVYESTKPVEAEVVENIKDIITKSGILGWSGLPESNYSFISDKYLTFIFKDADSITVKGDKILPSKLRSDFFNIELEMTTKH